MIFTDKELTQEFFYLKAKAKLLLCHADYLSLTMFDKPLVITKIFYEGGTGIHSLFRAFDVRHKDYYTEQETYTLVETINRHYPYDPARPEMKTCLKEEDCLHFQVCLP